jgi:hypothetical protein
VTFAKSLPIILPLLYVALFITTLVSGEKTASGGNPFFCLSLPWSLPLVARGDTAIVVMVGVLATAWWCFVGFIGRAGNSGKLSRSGEILGSGLIFIMCFTEATLMFSEFRLVSHELKFGLIDEFIYTLAVVLLIGGVISAVYAATAISRN